MKNKESLLGQRAKLLVTGTLAMFAMGSAHAESLITPEAAKAPKPNADGASADAAGKDQAQSSRVVHHFDIPAGTLGEVAAALQLATGLKVTVPQRYASLQSPGVKGVFTSEEGFAAALQGTSMSASFVSPELVALDLHGADQSVTVTAKQELSSLKYTAPLRDLPQTITVIPETVIENTGSTTLVEALRTVPGITFGAGEGGNPIGDRPFIRGVDSQSSTFVDGLRDIGSQSREVFDLESVEVSKGPSGGYAGRAASGGSLNLNSKMARHENFLAGSFSPGTANFFRGTVDGNVKINRWLDGRLTGLGQDTETAGRDFVQGQRYGVAPSIALRVTPRGRVAINYYNLNSADIPDPGIPYNNPADQPLARPDGRARVFQTGDGQPLLLNRNFFYGLRGRDFRNEKVRTAFGRAEYSLSEGTVLRNSYRYGTSKQDYLYSQADDSQGNIYYGLLYRRALQRVSSVDTSINQTDLSGHLKAGPFENTYAVGGEFSRERSWNTTYSVGGIGGASATPAIPNFFLVNPTTKLRANYSASRCPLGAGAAGGYYCEDLLNPTPDDPFYGVRTSVPTQSNPTAAIGTAAGQAFTQVGFTNSLLKNNTPIRQITATKSAYGFDTVRIWKLQGTGGVRYDHYDSTYRPALNAASIVPFAITTGLVNYQGALAYKPKSAGTIYGSVSKSSTPPGNSLSQGQDGSAITSVINVALPPETTRSEEAGAKWELFGGKALATGAFFYANTDNVRITLADTTIAAVGKRRNRGVDFSLAGNINRKLQLFGGYTFMNAILVDAGGAGAAAGLMNGRRFPNTPENSFSATGYYAVTRKLNLGGGVYGTGKVFGNDSPTAPKWVPGYVRVDLYGAYRFNPHVELQANMQNLTDKTYFLQAYSTHYATLAPGRQGRLTLNVRF